MKPSTAAPTAPPAPCPPDGLRIDVSRRLPHFTLQAAFDCPAGTLTAVVGPSGSGKTTLVRLLAGLDRPDTGYVLMGETVWNDPAARIHVPPQKRGLGYVFQEYSLLPHLSVWKNVLFGNTDPELAASLLARLGIDHLREAKPAAVSGGERQRVALAQALARRPRALLLDEPFSSLDPLTRHGLHQVLADLKTDLHIPMILVTHDIAEAFKLGDRVHPIRNGRPDLDWLDAAARVSGFTPPEIGPCGRRRGTGRCGATSEAGTGAPPGTDSGEDMATDTGRATPTRRLPMADAP